MTKLHAGVVFMQLRINKKKKNNKNVSTQNISISTTIFYIIYALSSTAISLSPTPSALLLLCHRVCVRACVLFRYYIFLTLYLFCCLFVAKQPLLLMLNRLNLYTNTKIHPTIYAHRERETRRHLLCHFCSKLLHCVRCAQCATPKNYFCYVEKGFGHSHVVYICGTMQQPNNRNAIYLIFESTDAINE